MAKHENRCTAEQTPCIASSLETMLLVSNMNLELSPSAQPAHHTSQLACACRHHVVIHALVPPLLLLRVCEFIRCQAALPAHHCGKIQAFNKLHRHHSACTETVNAHM